MQIDCRLASAQLRADNSAHITHSRPWSGLPIEWLVLSGTGICQLGRREDACRPWSSRAPFTTHPAMVRPRLLVKRPSTHAWKLLLPRLHGPARAPNKWSDIVWSCSRARREKTETKMLRKKSWTQDPWFYKIIPNHYTMNITCILLKKTKYTTEHLANTIWILEYNRGTSNLYYMNIQKHNIEHYTYTLCEHYIWKKNM